MPPSGRWQAGRHTGGQRVPPLCYHQSNSLDRAVCTPLSRRQSSLIAHFVRAYLVQSSGEERPRNNFSFERGIASFRNFSLRLSTPDPNSSTLRRMWSMLRPFANERQLVTHYLTPFAFRGARFGFSVCVKPGFGGRYLHACGTSAWNEEERWRVLRRTVVYDVRRHFHESVNHGVPSTARAVPEIATSEFKHQTLVSILPISLRGWIMRFDKSSFFTRNFRALVIHNLWNLTWIIRLLSANRGVGRFPKRKEETCLSEKN